MLPVDRCGKFGCLVRIAVNTQVDAEDAFALVARVLQQRGWGAGGAFAWGSGQPEHSARGMRTRRDNTRF